MATKLLRNQRIELHLDWTMNDEASSQNPGTRFSGTIYLEHNILSHFSFVVFPLKFKIDIFFSEFQPPIMSLHTNTISLNLFIRRTNGKNSSETKLRRIETTDTRSIVQTEQKWTGNVSIHDFYNICTLAKHTGRPIDEHTNTHTADIRTQNNKISYIEVHFVSLFISFYSRRAYTHGLWIYFDANRNSLIHRSFVIVCMLLLLQSVSEWCAHSTISPQSKRPFESIARAFTSNTHTTHQRTHRVAVNHFHLYLSQKWTIESWVVLWEIEWDFHLLSMNRLIGCCIERIKHTDLLHVLSLQQSV